MLDDKQQLHTERLLLYPIVLFTMFLPTLIDYFLKFYTDIKNTEVSEALKMLITHSLGFANALVYGFQRKTYFKSVDTKLETLQMVKSPMLSIRLDSIERNWRESKN